MILQFISSCWVWVVIIISVLARNCVRLIKARSLKKRKAYDTLLTEYTATIGKIIPNKSVVLADNYFTTEKWYVANEVNPFLIRSASSTLIGLGILGTFLGLAISLQEINFDGQEEEIVRSIQDVVGGMNTAFWSSVAGMISSLLFICIRSWFENNLQKKLADWSEDLDNQYYVDQIQLEAEQTEIIKSMGTTMGMSLGNQIAGQLEDSMAELINSIKEGVKDEMKEAGKYLVQSANMLQTSSEMLESTAEHVQKMTDGVNAILVNVNQTVTAISSLVTRIKSLHEEFGNTSSELGDSATQLDATIKTLDEKFGRMSEMLTTMQNAVHELGEIVVMADSHNNDVEKDCKSIALLIEQASSLAEKQQISFSKSLSDLEKTIGEVPNLKPDIEEIFKSINEGLKSYVELLQNQTSGLLSTYTREFNKACQTIQSTTGQLASVMEDSSANFTQAVNQSAQIMNEAILQIKDGRIE